MPCYLHKMYKMAMHRPSMVEPPPAQVKKRTFWYHIHSHQNQEGMARLDIYQNSAQLDLPSHQI